MRKVQLTIKQEEVAPATTSDLVLMNNGRTLKEELSTNVLDKFSREVTVDTSMSKVIDGTLDGVYESGVMYGRSLVNLSNLHKSFNDATLSDYYINTSLCETSKLKLGTPYTLVFYTTVHGGDHDIYSAFELGVGNELHDTNAHPKTTTNHWGTLVKNGWSKVCITFTDFLGYKYLSLRPIRCHAPESGKSIRFSIEGFILLEGDWSNKDLPFNDYFDGIGYCKMPTLRNVGKNLFDGSYEQDKFINEYGTISDSADWCATDFIRVRPNTTYTQNKNIPSSIVYFCFYNEDKQLISTTKPINYNRTFTTPNNCHFIRTSWKYSIDGFDFQFEEGTETTTYEDYKSNILRTPETVTLRSLPNGVRDELNVMTGEYIKRIGEVVLDGSETWYANNINNTTVCYYTGKVHADGYKMGGGIICDTFTELPAIGFHLSPNEGFFSKNPGYNVFYLVVSKDHASSASELLNYLSQNPITVQYELAEPITTIVEPLTIPFAYENGHIILESGHEGQSLLPELKYSVPASKNGVLSTTSQAILKHEQRLHKLENLLLREAILMDYRLALSFLDKM